MDERCKPGVAHVAKIRLFVFVTKYVTNCRASESCRCFLQQFVGGRWEFARLCLRNGVYDGSLHQLTKRYKLRARHLRQVKLIPYRAASPFLYQHLQVMQLLQIARGGCFGNLVDAHVLLGRHPTFETLCPFVQHFIDGL